jgi:prevent-host-death family protein
VWAGSFLVKLTRSSATLKLANLSGILEVLMTQYNMHEAKSKLSQLVTQALEGEEVILARDGQPTVRLVPIQGGERMPRQGRKMWSKTVLEFKGDPELLPFESYRDELERVKEIEL